MTTKRRAQLAPFMLLLPALGCIGETPPVDYLSWSDIYFPVAKEWQRFDELPLAGIGFQSNQISINALVESFYAKRSAENIGTCEPVLRQITHHKESFRQFDVNGDGQPDVVYSGPSGCAEGYRTDVWLKQGHSYQYDARFAANGMLLRVLPGQSPGYVMVDIGCCADPVDGYVLRKPGGGLMTYRTLKQTMQYVDSKPIEMAGTLTHSLTLRSSAEEKDEFDEATSEIFESAVYGNVVARFMAGAKFSALAALRNNGDLWYFVAVPRQGRMYREYSPAGVDAGWVKAAELY